MENNNNNLFSSMFGMESEEQSIQQPVEQLQKPQILEQPVQLAQTTIKPSIEIPTPQPVQEEIIVLDSNPIQVEQTPVVEQPEILNQLNGTTYTSLPRDNSENFYEYKSSKDSSYKTICIILGITLLIVVLAFPLYSVVNNYLSNNKSNDTTPNKQTLPQEAQPEEKEDQPQPEIIINFDMDLSFDKGYTTNTSEYQQAKSYKPESSEGVIKCENKTPLIHTKGVNNMVVYVYYKDYMAKKLLTIDDMTLNDYTNYSEYIKNFQAITAVTTENEHLFTKLLVDEKNYRINYYMLVDLAYNQAVRIPDSDYYIDITLSYNTPIQSAMNKFLGTKNYIGNMYCSTINTQDASL